LKISNCSLEIFVAEDAYVFVSHSFFISTNYNLCKRSITAGVNGDSGKSSSGSDVVELDPRL
jgi:hypothetical protein